jgi:hypothetical protein
MNLTHLGNSCKLDPSVALSWVVGQQISSTSAKLMQDKMKRTSSHIEILAQFHMKESYFVTLSCLRLRKQSLEGIA